MANSMLAHPVPQHRTLGLGMEFLIESSDCDNTAYQSPSLSPTTSEIPLARLATTSLSTPASLLPTSELMSGANHQHDQYEKQTRIVPLVGLHGLGVNQNSSQIPGYINLHLDQPTLHTGDDRLNANITPSQLSGNSADMDMKLESPNSPSPKSTTIPDFVGGQGPSHLPSAIGHIQQLNVQKSALPKTEARQRQRKKASQKKEQQQREVAQSQQTPAQRWAKHVQPTDAILEQKITQLLSQMRAKPTTAEGPQIPVPRRQLPRPPKNDEEMGGNERILPTEEGKTLSSKERRQLRNKASARAFRLRRKEYISQMESDLTNKLNENRVLRAENSALSEENKRLSDLTRMLVSSPSFHNFLDNDYETDN